MDLENLIQCLIPLINALNSNISSQSVKNSDSITNKNLNPKTQQQPDLNSPFFKLPTYQLDPKNVIKQDLNYSQNEQQNAKNPPQQNALSNLVNLLGQIDLSTLVPLLSNLFHAKKTPTQNEQKKDTPVSFKNDYTKVESFNYNEL